MFVKSLWLSAYKGGSILVTELSFMLWRKGEGIMSKYQDEKLGNQFLGQLKDLKDIHNYHEYVDFVRHYIEYIWGGNTKLLDTNPFGVTLLATHEEYDETIAVVVLYQSSDVTYEQIMSALEGQAYMQTNSLSVISNQSMDAAAKTLAEDHSILYFKFS